MNHHSVIHFFAYSLMVEDDLVLHFLQDGNCQQKDHVLKPIPSVWLSSILLETKLVSFLSGCFWELLYTCHTRQTDRQTFCLCCEPQWSLTNRDYWENVWLLVPSDLYTKPWALCSSSWWTLTPALHSSHVIWKWHLLARSTAWAIAVKCCLRMEILLREFHN